jgi:cytochrome c556
LNLKSCSHGAKTLLATAAIAVVSTVAIADDSDAVDYRQHLMTALTEQFAAVRIILAHKAPAADLAAQTEALALTAAIVKSAFEPKAAGGSAKAEIWTQWPDFAHQMDTLSAAAGDLAKTAKAGNLAAADAKAAALDCKSCHTKYTTLKP